MDDTPCTYRISTKAIITDDAGRILLLQEPDGSWELPGGGLEHGEDINQALARKITEETGLRVDWVGNQPLKFWTIRKDVGSPTLKWFAFAAYEVKVLGTLLLDHSSDEAQDARYFSRDEIAKLQLHGNTRPYFE